MDVRGALAVILLVTGVPLAAGYFGSGSSAAPAPVPAAPASTPTPMPTVASPPAWTHTEPAWAGVLPGDRKWIEAAIARARPDAVPLIRHVLGRVTFRTALRPRARWA